MILNKIELVDDVTCSIALQKDELRWLANSMNEVLNGIRIDASGVLSAPDYYLNQIHRSLIEKYNSSSSECVDVALSRQTLVILRKTITVVMTDFNKYNEYGTRLGVEFEEYIRLLSDVNDILDECFNFCMRINEKQ